MCEKKQRPGKRSSRRDSQWREEERKRRPQRWESAGRDWGVENARGIDRGTDKKKKKKRIQLGEMKKKKRKGTRAGKHRPFSRYLERGWRARGEVGRADWRRGNRAEKRVAAERGQACFSQARSVVSCGIVGGLDRAE